MGWEEDDDDDAAGIWALPVAFACASRTRSLATALGAAGAPLKTSSSSSVSRPLHSVSREIIVPAIYALLVPMRRVFGHLENWRGRVNWIRKGDDYVATFDEYENLWAKSMKGNSQADVRLTMCLQWFPFWKSGPRRVIRGSRDFLR